MNWPTSTNRNLHPRRLTRLLIAFSLLVLSAGIVWACADADEEDTSVFAPEYFVNKHYSPFFYDSYNRYYANTDSSQLTGNNARYNRLICAEWVRFLGPQLSPGQINFLLFTAKPKQADSVKRMAGSRLNGRGQTFFNYLALAKDCETFAVKEPNEWEVPPYKAPPAAIGQRINYALAGYKDPFIRERLWFQLVRYHFFQDTMGHKAEASFYRYAKEFPHNLIYYRTLGYLAGAEYAQRKYAQSNYHYSLCYNYTWQMYLPSQWSFHPQEEADWRQTLQLAKTPEEKITLWHLLGLEHDPGRAIREIAAINSRSDKMDVLLTRLINQYENSLEGDYPSPASGNLPADAGIVDAVASCKEITKPLFWHLAAGYLHYLHRDYKGAARWYRIAQTELPRANQMLQAQYKLLAILQQVSELKRMDAQAERRLVEPLNWLADLRDNKKAIPNLRFADALSQTTAKIAALYTRQGNRVRANYFKTQPHIYADSTAIDSIRQLLAKTGKTAFEQAMLRYYPVKLGDLYYQQALLTTYKENTGAAIRFMAKADPQNNVELPANPFTSRLIDCHDCEFYAPHQKYTPLQFLQTIQRLKNELKAGKNKYRNALQLGGAYYNLTHYGNSRAFFQTELTGGITSAPQYYTDDFLKMFTSQHIAQKYYTIALQNAATTEQKARCTFLLGKCGHNAYYNSTLSKNTYDEYSNPPPPGNWFSALKTRFATTAYYREILKECGYFRHYVNRK